MVRMRIKHIPVIVWGKESDCVYIHVHGKGSRKEFAETFANCAEEKGYQTLSFDLPEHGERVDNARCDVFYGVEELKIIADYAFSHWKHVCLYACSLGAYFSLNAYTEYPFEKVLFQSPVVDMKSLVSSMMNWFNIDEERLEKEKEIATPIDPLRWDYYCYIQSHPIVKWPFKTSVLYAGKDNLQSKSSIEDFVNQFSCILTVSENSEHPFMTKEDVEIVKAWYLKEI